MLFLKLNELGIFRERYLDFICSLDISDELPTQTLYQLFKQNLSKAEMLTYVHVFNMNDAEEQLDFVLGSQDKKQWMVNTERRISVRQFFEYITGSQPVCLRFDLQSDDAIYALAGGDQD